jgi:carboxyl-terminal processing protease
VLLATAVLLTYTLTAAVLRRSYTEKLLAQQALLDQNSALYQTAENLQILDEVLERYSYYADTLDEEAMREAVLHAYVQASGDVYARYYTEEEYEALKSANNAQMCGVGVGVVNKSFTADGQEQLGFYVFDIYEGSTAADVIGVGDFIWAIRIDGVMKTVSELGYSQAVSYISGAENSEVTLGVYRPKTNTFFDATLIRKTFESKSVYISRLENNPSVGIVRITSFDLKTPSQFKRAVNDLRNAGVTSFVFDVRSNPGGDLVSIRAIASYFLERGDLILDKVDRHGEIVQSYCAEPITYEGDSAACNVAESEIGMFRGLRMTVLCNENTASAAEVFTAVMKDYGLASVVGTKTFGKGIMQTIRKIALGDTVGYIKLTTHAYQTRNGSYHGVGITPNETVELSEDAKKESILILPQDRDEQLKTAVQRLLAVNQ